MTEYKAPLHYSCYNRSRGVDVRRVAYWVEACRQQLVSHVCPLWELLPPGAAVYPNDVTFPPETALVVLFVDDDGDPLAAGLHGAIGGVPYVLIDVHESNEPSVVLSHEFIETTVNQYLTRWTPDIIQKGHRYRYPYEPGDPVQRQTYTIPVDLGDGTRAISVSNFVLPSWFEPGTSSELFDFAGRLSAPLEIADGGYAAPMVDGVVNFESRGLVRLTPRRFTPWQRLARLMKQGKQ